MARKHSPKAFVINGLQLDADVVKYAIPDHAANGPVQLDEAAEQRALLRAIEEILRLDPKKTGFEKQSRVAASLGVSGTTLTRWKKGDEHMPHSRRTQLLDLLTETGRTEVRELVRDEQDKARRDARQPAKAPTPPRARRWVSDLIDSGYRGRQSWTMTEPPESQTSDIDPDDELDARPRPPGALRDTYSLSSDEPMNPLETEVAVDVATAIRAEAATLFHQNVTVDVTLLITDTSISDPDGWDRVTGSYLIADEGTSGATILLPNDWLNKVKHRPDGDFSLIGGRFVVALAEIVDDTGPALATALRALPKYIEADDLDDWEIGTAEARVIYDGGRPARLEWTEPDPARASIIHGQHVKEGLPRDHIGLTEQMGYRRPTWTELTNEQVNRKRIARICVGWDDPPEP